MVLRPTPLDFTWFHTCPARLSPSEKMATYRPTGRKGLYGFFRTILGIELTVVYITLSGNGEEGRHYITNKKQILSHHGKASKMALADATHNEHANDEFSSVLMGLDFCPPKFPSKSANY